MTTEHMPEAPDTMHPIAPLFEWHTIPGLTKRELFAAMAMQGYVSAAHRAPKELIVDDSIQLADALIAALNEGGEG